ncbi:flagellar filament capping protein FliD [Armatimonas sp.]|uniref:flagellar filament capping protein FliD n=1 Tax=Armatimonas sp. TaxID=1872638 RepID=UPI003752AC9E
MLRNTTNISGLVSGIDVESIIAKLSEVESRVTQSYSTQQSKLLARQRAYQDANTRMAAFKDAATKLSGASFFNIRKATVDNTSATVTAQGGAVPGQYGFTVNTLAQSHQVASQSYSDLTATSLGVGEVSIVAAGETTTVTLDASNNTLGGLRDSINAANTNVRASIIQDSASSYRLMLSSKETGESNAMTVTTSLSGGTDPSFTTLQAAQNAQVTLGSGPGAIVATRASNTLSDVIPGVTVNIASVAENTRLNISISQDTLAIEEGAKAFVDQYNNLENFITQQFKFDAETGKGGTLLGDFTLRGIQSEVQNVISSAVSGVSGGLSSLADVGISTGADGKLSLDSAMFQAKLAANPEGISRLFALTGSSTNAGVQFSGATTDTDTGGTAYAVNITQIALQARVTAGAAQAAPLTADETLTINGVGISLTAGMSRSDIVSAINARSSTTGTIARATAADGTGTGNYISLFSSTYGDSASISVVSSLSLGTDTSGFGNVTATEDSPNGESGSGTGNAGQSVAGTINGEAATGSGQTLTGNTGNAHTSGLRLRVTSGSTGALGSVKAFSGIAHQTERAVNQLTDTISGPIKTETDSLQDRIDDLQKVIDKLNDQVERNAQSLRARFNRMETTINRLQNQSQTLLSQLNKNNSSNN